MLSVPLISGSWAVTFAMVTSVIAVVSAAASRAASASRRDSGLSRELELELGTVKNSGDSRRRSSILKAWFRQRGDNSGGYGAASIGRPLIALKVREEASVDNGQICRGKSGEA